MKSLILAAVAVAAIFWGLLDTAATPGGALTAATGLSASAVVPVLIAAWRIARADIASRRRTA